MEKIIAGRHIDLDEFTKEFINDYLGKIEDEYKKLTSARVVVDVQKLTHYTEVILHGKNISIEAKDKNKDMYASINGALHKAEKQLKRFLDKMKDHHSSKKLKNDI